MLKHFRLKQEIGQPHSLNQLNDLDNQLNMEISPAYLLSQKPLDQSW
jgi:hypothetical protein